MIKLLLITPGFYKYDEAIIQSLKDNSAYSVYHLLDRGGRSKLKKILIRFPITRFIFFKFLSKHYFSLLSHNTVHFDVVLFINPELLNKNLLSYIRSTQPNARFICYLWDSLANKPQNIKLLSFFDSVSSFDPDDCIKHDLYYLPLFWVSNFSNLSKTIDCSFVGVAHSNRPEKILKTISKCKSLSDMNLFFYFYRPFKIQCYLDFFSLWLKGIKFDTAWWHNSPLSYEKYLEIIARSKFFFDIEDDSQSGLTSRTFEVLSSGTNLITTNKNIYNHFSSCDNLISILDDSFNINNISYSYISHNCKNRLNDYHINNWIKHLLSL